jgi:hypothetical protein
MQKYTRASTSQSNVSLPRGALDRRRLQRLLEYIEANLEGDLNLDLMASAACLSRDPSHEPSSKPLDNLPIVTLAPHWRQVASNK